MILGIFGAEQNLCVCICFDHAILYCYSLASEIQIFFRMIWTDNTVTYSVVLYMFWRCCRVCKKKTIYKKNTILMDIFYNSNVVLGAFLLLIAVLPFRPLELDVVIPWIMIAPKTYKYFGWCNACIMNEQELRIKTLSYPIQSRLQCCFQWWPWKASYRKPRAIVIFVQRRFHTVELAVISGIHQ